MFLSKVLSRMLRRWRCQQQRWRWCWWRVKQITKFDITKMSSWYKKKMKWKLMHVIIKCDFSSFIHSVAGLVVHRRFRITSRRKQLANGILLLLLLLLFLCWRELTMIVHGVKHTARNHVSHWKFIKSTSHFQQSLQANIYTIKHILLACLRFCFFLFFFKPLFFKPIN